MGRMDAPRCFLCDAAGTVENIKALISGIFTHAYEDEILAVNPALRLGRFIQKQDRRRHITPLTREQAATFLKCASTETAEHYPLLLCAFRTGLRLGEVLGLAWEDVNFPANTIEIRRAFSHGRFSTPKSHKSRVTSKRHWTSRASHSRRNSLDTPKRLCMPPTVIHL